LADGKQGSGYIYGEDGTIFAPVFPLKMKGAGLPDLFKKVLCAFFYVGFYL
jgi:hypothetical protein